MHNLVPGMELTMDVADAAWIPQRLRPWRAHPGEFRVASLVPDGFEAYLRIFHPARGAGGRPIRWAEVAAWSGRTVHPEMQFAAISRRTPDHPGTPPPWDAEYPEEGSFAAAGMLAGVLARHTTTPQRCRFAVWDGYGVLSPGGGISLTSPKPSWLRRRLEWWRREKERRASEAALERIPRLHCEARSYLLYRGSAADVDAFLAALRQSPNLWWPEDRAWIVATEIDLDSTVVAATREAAEAVLADGRFEAVPVTLESRLDAAADGINRP